MKWIKACRLTDLPVGHTYSLALADEFVLLCRVSETEIYAIENICTHDDGPLGEGDLNGTVVECPRHGARFDVTNGTVLRLPAATSLATYPVRLTDDWIEVALEGWDDSSDSEDG